MHSKTCGHPRTRGRKADRRLRKFAVLFDLLMGSRGYTAKALLQACDVEPTFNLCSVINFWRSGLSSPQRGKSLSLLETIERHFEIPAGHLSNLLRFSSTALFQEV